MQGIDTPHTGFRLLLRHDGWGRQHSEWCVQSRKTLDSRLRGNDEGARGNDEGARGNDEGARGNDEGRAGMTESPTCSVPGAIHAAKVNETRIPVFLPLHVWPGRSCHASMYSDVLRREAASEGEFSIRVVLGLDHVSPFGRVLALVECGCGG